jgi:hypothetical protein
MPRIKHQIQEEHLNEIKSLIEYTFGRKILNTNDCIDLSVCVFEKEKLSISTDTLRRVFQLVETSSQPSLYTLEILSKYVGFSGYYDFVDSVALVGKYFLNKQILECISGLKQPYEALNELKKCSPSIDYYNTLQQLIILAFQKKDAVFFQNIFENQPGFEWLTKFKYEIFQTIQVLGKYVEENEWLQQIAFNHYIGLPFNFDYFVEWYVAEDKIYYIKLLEKYKEVHQNRPEKLMFYYSINSLIHYRINDFKNLKDCNNSLRDLEKSIVPNNILKARLLGVYFLNNFISNNSIAHEQILTTDFELLFPDIGDRVTSMFFLFNYLFEAKAYELIIELFERWLTHDVPFFSIWTRINWNQICVYLVYAYSSCNQTEKATTFHSQINPTLFEVYNQKKFLTLYENSRNLIK